MPMRCSLLSDGSGKVVVLFSYMAIINIGILIFRVSKNIEAVVLRLLGLTWLIFVAWRLDLGSGDSYFNASLSFLPCFS